MLLSPDFRLPGDEASQGRSLDHRHTLSACSCSPTDSSRMVGFHQNSWGVTFRHISGKARHMSLWASWHHPFDFVPARFSVVCPFVSSRGLPAVTCVISSSAKVWLQTIFCGSAYAPLKRLLTNSRGRASSGCFEELLRELFPVNLGQGGSVTPMCDSFREWRLLR